MKNQIIGNFRITLTSDLVEDLIREIPNFNLDGFKFTEIRNEDDTIFDYNHLKLSLGGDEINVLKLFFEAGIATAVEIAGDQIIKWLERKKKEKDNKKTPIRNEVVYPDGTIVKV